MPAELDEVLDAAAGTVDAALDVARRNGNDLCYIATYQLQILRSALTQARVDREEVERLRDKHHPDCDALAREPSGIVKPCNCFLTRVANLYLRIEALAKGLREIAEMEAEDNDTSGFDLADGMVEVASALLAARTAAAKEGT